MSDPKCKICRRAGEKLFLKGAKCFTPKCTFERKPSPPGKPLSERKHRTNITEYGVQLKEKQKIRNVYGVSEKQFSRYVKEATSEKGASPVAKLYEKLERRLDNVVFRMGLAQSRAHARQMVSHGHIMVGKHKLTIPSFQVSEGDTLRIREGSKSSPLFTEAEKKLNDAKSPAWMTIDAAKGEIKIVGTPKNDKSEVGFNWQTVIEFYSR
ncbi:MAG TPA: 30S ribosomal protein S4 [Candidatus Paceibacterota bacterium]|nr:30S ribosomal protein S4 [Candidatus Paceibacterota bacterium]